MMFIAAQSIQEIFGMRKVKPGLAKRWSIVIREGSQHPEDNGLIHQENAEFQHDFYQLDIVNSMRRRQIVVWDEVSKQDAESGSLKQAQVVPPISLQPKHFPKPNMTLAVTHSPKISTSCTAFHQNWRHCRVIGEGGDGIVHQFQQRQRKNEYVAVKVPQYSSACQDIEQEVVNLRRIGPHEHILPLLDAVPEWIPYGPALVLPYCEMGDLIHYRKSWCAQQKLQGLPERVSEITMCKLFRDIALALDHLHNCLGTRYIHNDLKPENILAAMPDNYVETDVLPEEPVFKITDFARLTPWPTPIGQHPKGFNGTYEYAPPKQERVAPILPSADIWSLGATLQYMALGICPIQSRKAFIWSRKGAGKSYPDFHSEYDWTMDYWRQKVPTVFRPINLPTSVLRDFYDLPHDIPDYQPFSARLGYWYAQLFKPVGTHHKGRPRASRLVREVVPQLVNQIERLKARRYKEMQRIQEIQLDEIVAVGGWTELE